MQFLRCIELMQLGPPVSVKHVADCTRTSRESVRGWMVMLEAHGRVERLGADVVQAPRLGAPAEWWRWKTNATIPKGCSEMADELAKAQAQRNPWGLTPRETEVMAAVCKARSHKLAALELGVEPITVKTATQRIGRKMKIGGRNKYIAWQAWIMKGKDEELL